VDVVLNDDEIAEIDKQDPATKGDGGFQTLLVSLQSRIDRATGRLSLTLRDLQRIREYAFNYGRGTWENRLRVAFERTLGPNLDGVLP
jgi:hypothetical protein